MTLPSFPSRSGNRREWRQSVRGGESAWLRRSCRIVCLGNSMNHRLLGLLVFLFVVIAETKGDVLVIAPHPDDEVIGCTGVILRALEAKEQVTVVILTNGDGYAVLTAAATKKERAQLTPEDFMKAGALRQEHSVKAMKRLGVPRENLIFLGYPDSGLERMWEMDGSTTFRQMLTQKRETYGLTGQDYHSLTHGEPAPYLKASVVADLAEIVRARKPQEVFVSHESDKHGDHRAAFWYVRDALRAAAFQGRFLAYVVHGDPLPREPDLRVHLLPHEYETKRAAIIDHTQGTSPVHDGLVQEYLKPEELFWQFPIR